MNHLYLHRSGTLYQVFFEIIYSLFFRAGLYPESFDDSFAESYNHTSHLRQAESQIKSESSCAAFIQPYAERRSDENQQCEPTESEHGSQQEKSCQEKFRCLFGTVALHDAVDHEDLGIALRIISIHLIEGFVAITHSPFHHSGRAVVDLVSGFLYLPIEVGVFSPFRQIFRIASNLFSYFFGEGDISG